MCNRNLGNVYRHLPTAELPLGGAAVEQSVESMFHRLWDY